MHLVSLRKLSSLSILWILVHGSIFCILAYSILILTESFDNFLVNKDGKWLRWQHLGMSNDQGLARFGNNAWVHDVVSLNPLPEVRVPTSLQIQLILNCVLNVPRIDKLSLINFPKLKVEIEELFLFLNIRLPHHPFNLFFVKRKLGEVIDHSRAWSIITRI